MCDAFSQCIHDVQIVHFICHIQNQVSSLRLLKFGASAKSLYIHVVRITPTQVRPSCQVMP